MPRGRTRDEAARRRVLEAAFELVGSHAPGQVTVNAIAEAAQVGKQTIYRWWPSRTAVLLDALVDGTMRATPFPETDDVRADFEHHLRRVVALFMSPTGRIIRELVAEAQADEGLADEFVARFWNPRRQLSLQRLERGVELGQVRDGLDHELVLDSIYGALWTRLLVRHRSLRRSDASAILSVVWPGLAAT